MSAKAACCFVENGNPCDCGGVYQVTLHQLERTVAAKRAKNQPELLYDYFVTCNDEKYWVCAEHAYDIIKAHLAETYEVASGKARMERRDMIKEILWCTGTHENQDPGQAEKLAAHIVESNAPPKPDTPRRVSRPTGDHPVVGDDKVMKLRKLFDRALPFIHVQSFTYVLMITMLRSVLILNGIFEYGRHVWHGDKEGTDFLRFCAVLYTVVGAPGIELLRGGAVPKDAQQTVDGIYDLRLKNIPCIPGARQIRNYIATPFRIQDMIRASEPLVDAALAFFGGGQMMLGATFDCVYGETYFEVVKDLDQKYVLLGGSSVDGLVSAALDADRAAGLDKLEAKDHATKLMTVVLHLIVGKDKEKRPKATLVAVIPIHDETGVIISNVYLELRRLIFARGSWLVFGGGDGAVPNLEAWRIVSSKSKGDQNTVLSDVEDDADLPFWSAGDDDQHNTKGLKRDAFGEWMLVNGKLIRLDRQLAELRGFVPSVGAADVELSVAGDPSFSSVGGVKLVDVLGPVRAVKYHEEFAAKATIDVIDPKDTMASRPAHKCGQLGPHLREVGLTHEAHYCDLMAQAEQFARGLDENGNTVTPRQNLEKIEDLTSKLTAMRDACESRLEQGSRGGTRRRGFITEQLFALFLSSAVAWRGIIELAEKNGMAERLRNTLPYSAVNETEHNIMRRIDKHLRISTVLRGLSKIVAATSIIHDLARSWVYPGGMGAEGDYRNTLDDSPEKRSAALERFARDEKYDFELTTSTARKKAFIGDAKPERGWKPPAVLSKLAAATLAGVRRVKLAFRDAVVHAKGGGDAAKYGKTASKRRSLLARAMEAPHLLKRVDAKGRARAFQVGKVFLVDGSAAWMLDCVGKLDAPTVICRQHPEKAVLELDVLSKETYTVSFDSIYAISWDLRHDSTPQDKDGVVVITLAIVSSGLLQILALELVKKDVNTCRMLMNLQGLQPTILESALVEGGVPTPRAQLLRAVVRDPLVGEPTLSVDGHETPWQRVDLAQAVSAMRGPARLAVVPTTEPPPSLQSLIVAASATTGGLALKPAKAARRRKRALPEAVAGPRTVVAKIEQSDKDALEKELVRNLKSLEAKWKGLYVRDEGMGFSGEILNFEWKNRSSGVRPAQFCAVIESHDGNVCESYSVLDLPEMVIAAESEQPEGVVLVYDRQQVDEFELLGDEEAKEMERMIPDEESEDEDEEDEL